VVAAALAAGLAIIGIGMSQSGTDPIAELRRQAFAAAGAIVLGLALHGALPRLLVRVAAPVGLISYSVYLLHWSVLRELVLHGFRPPSGIAGLPVTALVMAAITVGAASVSYLVVERPAMQWAAARARRLRRAGGVAVVAPVAVASD
jgi:peptidoglycan/LPS O-acetylase OafA/YrhL